MKNFIANLISNLSTLIENTNININLEGWPAAVTAISICGTGVAICALKVTHPNQDSSGGQDSNNTPVVP